jgi:hypothetical protein
MDKDTALKKVKAALELIEAVEKECRGWITCPLEEAIGLIEITKEWLEEED